MPSPASDHLSCESTPVTKLSLSSIAALEDTSQPLNGPEQANIGSCHFISLLWTDWQAIQGSAASLCQTFPTVQHSTVTEFRGELTSTN